MLIHESSDAFSSCVRTRAHTLSGREEYFTAKGLIDLFALQLQLPKRVDADGGGIIDRELPWSYYSHHLRSESRHNNPLAGQAALFKIAKSHLE